MTHPDFSRVRRLVELVHDLGPEERARVLDRECGADLALRAEVLELLDAARAAPGLLERAELLPAAAGLAAQFVPELGAGTRVGGFRLVGRIASGGMGTVFEAEQDAPRRRVALKLLRFASPSSEAARRFRHESEILASLRHPCIAQVYASGAHALASGELLPWYAMERVEDARSLTDYADERRLGLEQRLALFADLCGAVQHAHERGVIHRDLKPSNVLVDSAGRLKVIDFGVARARGPGGKAASFETEAGRVIGTLQYMAPEQLAGASDGVDTRSDVYALGAMLYELVTGAPLHDLARASLAEAASTLATREPPRPSARKPGLPADLDAVVQGALAKDRERRYASAAALGEDVRRLLAGEPVLARAPSAAYQLRVLARRHRAWVAAGALVVLVSLGAALVSLGYAWRAREAERVATRRFDDVRGLARSILFDLHDAIERLPGATAARRELADTGLCYLDALEREAGGDADLLQDLAEGRLRLGLVLGAPGQASLGDREAGERELRRALATSERLLAARPDAASRIVRARVLEALGDSERAAGRLEGALEVYARAEQDAGAAALSDPAVVDAEHFASVARLRRARILALLGRSAEAAAVYAEDLRTVDGLRERRPDDAELMRSALLARIGLGELHLRAAKSEEALALFEEALALAEEQLRRLPASSQAAGDLALALTWRGRARSEGGSEGGLEDLERAVALRREQLARDADDSTAASDLAAALQRLGAARRRSGDAEGAVGAAAEALELARRGLERSPSGFEERLAVAEGELALAEALLGLGSADEARAALERSLELLCALEDEAPASLEVARSLGTLLLHLADDLRRAGDLEPALSRYEEARERLERAARADPGHAWARRMVMVVHCWRGVAHKAAAEAAAGASPRAHYEQALEAFENALALEPELARAGFLEPGDARAVELVRADVEACRRALAELTAP